MGFARGDRSREWCAYAGGVYARGTSGADAVIAAGAEAVCKSLARRSTSSSRAAVAWDMFARGGVPPPIVGWTVLAVRRAAGEEVVELDLTRVRRASKAALLRAGCDGPAAGCDGMLFDDRDPLFLRHLSMSVGLW